MANVFYLAAMFLVFLAVNPVLAAEIWRELATPNFYLAGSAEEKDLRETAQKLEDFQQNVQASFRGSSFRTPFRTNVLVLKKALPIFPANPNFLGVDDARLVIISAEQSDPGTDYRIRRDYARFLFDNNPGPGKIPAWLNIALGEYFARANGENPLLIEQQNNLGSLKLLLETDYYTLQNQPEERKAIFRAQAWALLRFLLLHKAGGDFGRIEDFIAQLVKNGDMREALFLNFTLDLKSLESEFGLFLKAPKLFIAKLGGRAKVTVDHPVTVLSEARRLAVLGDFLLMANRPKDAARMLENSLALDSDHALALSSLALIKAREFYYDEAEELAERAIRSEPDNYLFYYRYAVALSRQGMTEYGFVSGYSRPLAEKMRFALNRAIELNPAFAEAYALLCFVNYVRNENLDESRRLIDQALRIAPGNQRYLLRLAEIDLRRERFTEARKIALEVYRTAPSEQLKLYSQNTIQRIDSTENQLAKLRNEKARYVNDEIVTDKPLSDEEIRRLREKATVEQIRMALKRPRFEESRTVASLIRIECGKDRIEFIFKSASGPLKLQARSFDGISLLSFIEEMSDFRLGCGNLIRDNNASIIFKNEKESGQAAELLSIEFVPKSFQLSN
jgi:tetratricopeptide (TPR) repeat protein